MYFFSYYFTSYYKLFLLLHFIDKIEIIFSAKTVNIHIWNGLYIYINYN